MCSSRGKRHTLAQLSLDSEVIRVQALRQPRDGRRRTWTLATLLVAGAAAWVLAPVVLAAPRKALKEYWFDWKSYQPATAVYDLGTPRR
jgi:hypothetical protein